MNYTEIINKVVAEAIDREVENRLAAKNGEIAHLKELLAGRDKELVALRGDVLDRGNRIDNLQTELNGVRGALKNHVDSENKLKKELDDANARIVELEADLDTRIDELEDKVREKDSLIEKYKDMADAFDDWTNDMPSIDPNDY